MKFKSLLAILFIAPITMIGNNKGVDKINVSNDGPKVDSLENVVKADAMLEQRGGTNIASSDVVFVNSGSMYVAAKSVPKGNVNGMPSEANQVLYVGGSFDASTSVAQTGTETLIADKAAVAIVGNVKDLKCTLGTGFTTGAVWMLGDGEEDEINLYSPTAVLAEKLGKASYRNDGTTTLKKKQFFQGVNVIPNLVVDKQAFVSLEAADPVIGDKNSTILHIGNTNEYDGNNVITAPLVGTDEGTLYVRATGLFSMKTKYVPGARELNIPLLGIANEIVREGENGTAADLKGEVMYEMNLYQQKIDPSGLNGPVSYLDNGVNSNIVYKGQVTHEGKVEEIRDAVMLTPFVSPYVELGGDHMFFNTLTAPEGQQVGGEVPLLDPKYKLQGGKAYFIAQDVTPYDHGDIGTEHDIKVSDRAHGGYLFNRAYFLSKKAKFDQFVSTDKEKLDIFKGEVFRTDKEKEPEFVLTAGFNYISNPYLLPITLAEFNVDWSTIGDLTVDLDGWSAEAGEKVSLAKDPVPGKKHIRAKFWVPNEGKIQYYQRKKNSFMKDFYTYNLSFWVNQTDGGTLSKGLYPGGTIIPPLSVFALQANDGMIIKIPKRLQIGNQTGIGDLEPGIRGARVDESKRAIDDILLETRIYPLTAAADGTEDVVAVDRATVVLRENATFAYDAKLSDDFIDAEKVFTSIDAMFDDTDSRRMVYSPKALADNVNPLTTIGGALYTKSSDGVALTANAVPLTVREVPVYFTPTQEEMKVVIQPYRLESLQAFEKVWLIDKYEDQVIELTPETEYEFISKPLPSELADDNRFILRFGFEDEEIIVDEELPIYCHYNTNTLFIGQLNDNDINSSVRIYDMQGRLVGASKISNVPNDIYTRPLNQGAYIVKIEGYRKFTTKIMVLP